MKKLICFIICTTLLAAMTIPATAAEQDSLCSRTVTFLDNDITITEEITILSNSRSADKVGQKKATVTRSGETIAIIVIQATFRYDGSSVSVISKSVTQKTTYNGWNYSQNSFTSSGGTVTLNAKLTKLLVLTQNVTVSLTCDKNGNLS